MENDQNDRRTSELATLRRLKRLNLHRLERCGLRGALIEAFKWIKKINDWDLKVFILKTDARTCRSGHTLDIFKFSTEM